MQVSTISFEGDVIETREFDQNTLTSDCWPVQFDGLIACKCCEYWGSDDCGGGETLRKLNNLEVK